ncbi:carboxymuconolactone decarboxylase [Limnohabitans sp. 2KL-1]|uniref:carboxymuconolactone decarboxylase family protein n=1 Tax=Limnohabitans sp. 2KL-1 TaxID=1100699 RepID=UPI000D33DC27|nr:carboxymuconolactone decarboxylase family protein [Limnohabitans sp. 2KL-1]PUE46452.1 carboxymuconolactone decarboxylase [Limnohabitans sp. 2KL-1]
MSTPHSTDSSPTPISDALHANGYWNPNWDPIAEVDKVWMEKFLNMGLHGKHMLDPKTFELIAIAVDASCTHMYAPGVRTHIRKALELGVTKEEIAAVLQLTSVLGVHTMSMGAPILLEEVAARQTTNPT